MQDTKGTTAIDLIVMRSLAMWTTPLGRMTGYDILKRSFFPARKRLDEGKANDDDHALLKYWTECDSRLDANNELQILVKAQGSRRREWCGLDMFIIE